MSENKAVVSRRTLFLTDDDVRRAFDWREASDALRKAYAATISHDFLPPRTMARGSGLWLRTLSGVSPTGDIMGAKLIAASTRHRRASYLIPLFDQTSVELIALLDGNAITGFRTAGTSALAADVLTPSGACRLAVLGSGFEARNHVRALAAIRRLESVSVFSPNPDSRAAFVQALADLNVPIQPAESPREAMKGADILLCAARSRGEVALFDGAWLEPGVTIISIGSTLPEQREIDPETVRRASVIVADMPEEVANDTGDMIAAATAGIAFREKLVSLADVVGDRHRGRISPEDIVLYKSVGSALQDLSIAQMCVTRAEKLSVGTLLPVSISPVLK